MNLTKQDAIFKHRILWCHIGHYLEKGIKSKKPCINDIVELKYIFINRFYNFEPPCLKGGCFLCHYASEMTIANFNVDPCEITHAVIKGLDPCRMYCPLNGCHNNDNTCLCGLYKKVKAALRDSNFKEASKIAYKIAFLKEVVK